MSLEANNQTNSNQITPKILIDTFKDFFKTDGSGEVKDVDDVSIFECEDGESVLSEDLLTEDGFINALFENDETKETLSKDQLAILYSEVANIDGEEGMTEEELKILASYGQDNFDKGGTRINEIDLSAMVKDLQTGGIKLPGNDIDDDVTSDEETVETSKADFIVKENKSSNAPKIQTDENGNKFIECKDDKYSNSLYVIVENYYDWSSMGISKYSEEFYQVVEQVMNANPEIFGEDKGNNNLSEHRKRTQLSANIYNGYKFVLPEIAGDGYMDGKITNW